MKTINTLLYEYRATKHSDIRIYTFPYFLYVWTDLFLWQSVITYTILMISWVSWMVEYSAWAISRLSSASSTFDTSEYGGGEEHVGGQEVSGVVLTPVGLCGDPVTVSPFDPLVSLLTWLVLVLAPSLFPFVLAAVTCIFPSVCYPWFPVVSLTGTSGNFFFCLLLSMINFFFI